MRIEALLVHAFGPFLDRIFEFAPGFNLVHGPNESGKSSLHAALYAALCGVRRGRGRSAAEHEFDRYRPWRGDGSWRVSVRLRLADGRRVEVVQDLEDKPRSRAIDSDLGRDVTQEILPKGGTPDASIWLGLDRRAFLATACVRQAELVRIRSDSGALREHLQRAVATSGTDATAAEALAHIEACLKEQVGLKQVNSTKPLRRAMDRVESARRALETAQQEHAAYLDLLKSEDGLVEAHAAAEREWRIARAASALAATGKSRRDLDRAHELALRHPDGPPPGLVADDELARDVDRAVHAYDTRPAPPDLEGPAAVELREELEALERECATLVRDTPSLAAVGEGSPALVETQSPERAPELPAVGSPIPVVVSRERVPEKVSVREERVRTRGRPLLASTAIDPREPGPSFELREAVERVRAAHRLVAAHAARRPPVPQPVAGGASAEELRSLADILSRPEPVVDFGLEPHRRELEERIASHERRGRWMRRAALGLGALAGALSIVMVIASAARAASLRHAAGTVAALLAAAAGAVLAVLAVARRRPVEELELREVEKRLLEARWRHDDWAADHDAARAAARLRGLEPEPEELRTVAEECARAAQARAKLATWEETDGGLHADLAVFESVLRRALSTRGVAAGEDALADAERYERLWELRASQRELAARLARRERDEAARARGLESRHAAEASLREVAARCAAGAEELDACRTGLEGWRASRRRALEAHERGLREWAELERLLTGESLEALEREVTRLETQAQELAAPFVTHEILAVDCSEEELGRRGGAVREAETALERLRVEIRLRAQAAPRVAEAEEVCLDAERELERVLRLEKTLLETREFLRQAQDRVHRDVAPALAAAVREALPAVTSGRYDEVRVDPEILGVGVHERGGDWRDAAALSHGTTEQIYLLLRMAMARHLVRGDEMCPLLLDDVTVQFDRDRKRAVLEMLRQASTERQILLLTQEEDVLDWARQRLAPPHDAVLRLEPGGSVA